MQKIQRRSLARARNRSCLERIFAAAKSADRHYDPEVGRFLTKDQILFGDTPPGLAQPPKPTATEDVNLYSYVMNDPINFIDPDGYRPTSPGTGDGPEVKNSQYCDAYRACTGFADDLTTVIGLLPLPNKKVQACMKALGMGASQGIKSGCNPKPYPKSSCE